MHVDQIKFWQQRDQIKGFILAFQKMYVHSMASLDNFLVLSATIKRHGPNENISNVILKFVVDAVRMLKCLIIILHKSTTNL